MKKLSVLITMFFYLTITASFVLADLIPMECASANPPAYCKYGNYKGPLYLTFLFFNPMTALLINFSSILIISALLGYFYMGYKNIKALMLGSFVASIAGAAIDSVSLFASSVMHDYFYSTYLFDASGLTSVFAASLFLVSFVLLSVMYLLIIRKIFKINHGKKIIISSVILAILTNPVWLYFL